MLALVIDTSSAAVTAAIVDFADAETDADAETGSGRAGGAPRVGDPRVGDLRVGDLRVLAERVTVDARAHAELLSPSVAACLNQLGAAPADLGAVIVGLGPGPFTGLRVGLVTAAAVADALDVPVYGVCSLDAIAAGAGYPGRLLVAGDARRREVYWARYAQGFPDQGERLGGPEVARAGDVVQDGCQAMAGAGARLYRDEFALPLLDADYPPAHGLARLAVLRVRAGAPSETLIPLYLRRPDAVPATSFKAVTP